MPTLEHAAKVALHEATPVNPPHCAWAPSALAWGPALSAHALSNGPLLLMLQLPQP